MEISEGARISDILQAVGARVLSVGSANCVYLADYERAISGQTAMLLRIRVSNMASSGYIAHVSGSALAKLAQKHNLFYVDNLGGGSLVDLTKQGLPECPTLQQGIEENAHLVLASGDKIIGGPQAGIIVGKKDCVSLSFSSCPRPHLSTSQVDIGRTGGNAGSLCRRPCLGRNPDFATAALPRERTFPTSHCDGKRLVRCRNGGDSRSGCHRVRRRSFAWYCISYLDHSNQASATH